MADQPMNPYESPPPREAPEPIILEPVKVGLAQLIVIAAMVLLMFPLLGLGFGLSHFAAGMLVEQNAWLGEVRPHPLVLVAPFGVVLAIFSTWIWLMARIASGR